MATKVFISWSGELSRKLGEALRTWLPGTLQYVRPYFTPDDIEKGTKWDSEIAKELESSDIGLICLTRDNTEKPWILFEAGALSKNFDKSRVCTVIFNVDPADLKGPLARFQHTKFIKEDFKKLVASINSGAGELKLDAATLDSVFEMWWPRLDQQVTEILGSHDGDQVTGRRPEREIIEEILELTRMNASAQMEGRRFRDSEAITSMILDEMKGIVRDIPSQVTQRLAEDGDPIRRRRMRRFHPMMMEEMMHMTGDEDDPIGILIMASMVRDELPWLYEISVDAYRAVKSGTPSEVKREIGRLRRISEFVMGSPFMEEFGMGSKETHMFFTEFPHMLERLLRRRVESEPVPSTRQKGPRQ